MNSPRFRLRLVLSTTAVLLLHASIIAAQELLPAVDFRNNLDWTGEFWPGDFDDDGSTDLAVRDRASGALTVVLGGGGEIQSNTDGWPLGTGDVDGDGDVDLLARVGSSVVVLPGNGDGTLGAPRTVMEADLTFAVVADMDGDGHRDVVVGEHADALHVVPGNGDFTFRPPVTMTTGTFPHGATVADFDGDDLLDVAVAHRYDRRLVVFRNDGGFLFTRRDTALDHPSTDVTARDLNGDGHLDLAVSVRESADGNFGFSFGAVDVFPGTGDGTFGPAQRFPTMNGPISLVVGDFTRDGRLDIATTNGPQFRADNSCGQEFGGESLSILPGNGDGTFGPPTSFALGRDLSLDTFETLNTSDLDGDGFTDLLVGFGHILLTAAPRANRPPQVLAGEDRIVRHTNQISVRGQAFDPDGHYLTYSWSDGGAGGNFHAPVAGTCYEPPFEGSFTLTLTVDDGQGGVGSDSLNLSYAPSEDGPEFTGQPIFEGTGSVTYEDGTYTVSGGGGDIWGDEDDFYFVHAHVSGDFDFTARVTSVENVHRWTKAGLMIRRGLATGSPHVSIFATPTTENGLAFQRRLASEESSVHTPGPAVAPPVWLRLSRRGATITALYRITESDPWKTIASDSLLPTESDRVGLAVSSHLRDGTQATATFEEVTLERVDGQSGGLPQGWSNRDIGAVSAAGSASFADGAFTVNGSGADIWGTADEFHYASVAISGEFEVTARAAHVQNVNRWTKAGLMIREALAAGARHASIFATPSTEKPVSFQRRPVADGTSVHTAGPTTTPPVWLRLVRAGDLITAFYRKNDTDAWVEVGRQQISGLSSDVQVGLAVSSHMDAQLATATFDNVEITRAGGALPPGWSSRDVGAVAVAGSAAHAGGTFTIEGSGADIWGTADEFHFVSRPLRLSENPVELTARVTSVENVHRWTKVGIMVRDHLGASSPHAMLVVTPTTEKGVAFQRRSDEGAQSTHTAGPAITAPVWLKLILSGQYIRAYSRKEATDPWTFVGEQVRPLRPFEVEIGLAVSSHVDGTLATATFDNVSVVHQQDSLDSRDIGAVGVPGASRRLGNLGWYEIDGSGADIWGTADAFHFVSDSDIDSFQVGERGRISARVLDIENTDRWAKAGVMIRESYAPDSPHVMVVVTPGRGIAMQYRTAAGGTSSSFTPLAGAAPAWVRLTRDRTTFVGEASLDGVTWHQIGRVEISMTPEFHALAGLAVTSHNNTTLATAVFDEIRFEPFR